MLVRFYEMLYRLTLTSLLLIFGTLCSCQNLLYNGSFEEISSCPSGPGQITLALGWASGVEGTAPGLYSTCSTDPVFSPPNIGPPNSEVVQVPDGNNYVRVDAYTDQLFFDYEILRGQLKVSLDSGSLYRISCLIYPRYEPIDEPHIFTDGIGFFVSSDSTSLQYGDNLSKFGQFRAIQFSDEVILPSSQWVEFTACFESSGGEKYLFVGGVLDTQSVSQVEAQP